MVVCLEIENWVIGKCSAKGGEGGDGVCGGRDMGAAVFQGPCVCLGVVLLL
jgi:hypothetical protein